MIDLRSVLSQFATPLTIQRRSLGYWSSGRYIGGSTTTISTRAVVQPGANNTRVLPEGVHVEDAAIVWTSIKLYDAQDPEGQPADRFVWQGRTFEVQQLDDRNADGNGKFWRAVAVRVRDSEADEA